MDKKLFRVNSCAAIVLSSVALSATASQYNISLEDKTSVCYNGTIASPYTVEVDHAGQMDEKRITK